MNKIYKEYIDALLNYNDGIDEDSFVDFISQFPEIDFSNLTFEYDEYSAYEVKRNILEYLSGDYSNVFSISDYNDSSKVLEIDYYGNSLKDLYEIEDIYKKYDYEITNMNEAISEFKRYNKNTEIEELINLIRKADSNLIDEISKIVKNNGIDN